MSKRKQQIKASDASILGSGLEAMGVIVLRADEDVDINTVTDAMGAYRIRLDKNTAMYGAFHIPELSEDMERIQVIPLCMQLITAAYLISST